MVIFVGSSGFKCNTIRFTTDPFYDINPTVVEDIYADYTTVSIPTGGKQESSKIILFNDIDLAKLFGFKRASYITGSVDGYSFKSEKPFELADYADSFVIELMNIPINSFDGHTNQRRNILHTITQTAEIRERLTFTAHFPLYLDINNANEMTLRRIRARILREDLSPIITSGFSQITILISE